MRDATPPVYLRHDVLHWLIVMMGWIFALGLAVAAWSITPWFPW